MFNLKISNTINNHATSTTLQYNSFRDFISNENTSSKIDWTIDLLNTDDTMQEMWEQFVGKKLYELQYLCRKMLHKDIETKNCMLSNEHMKLFSQKLSPVIEQYNYDENTIINYYSNMGASYCEYRPNKLAGYSFFGNNATVQFTDENIDLITYKLTRKKLLTSVIKYLKNKDIKYKSLTTITPKLIHDYSFTMSKTHYDLDNRQIPGQLNIFDYEGIA